MWVGLGLAPDENVDIRRIDERLKPKVLTFGAAFVLALLTAWTTGMMSPGTSPTELIPLPFPWVWLAWILGPLSPLLLGGLFCIWCGPLFYGEPTGAWRTRAAAAMVTLLSLLWFHAEWEFGLKYETFPFTRATAIGSLVFSVVIGAILASAHRRRSFIWSLAANFLIFAWLATYAFPYLGEML
jgi:hypothetical protein